MDTIIPDSNLIDRLRAQLGERGVLTDPADTAPYCEDWRRLYRGRTPAVLRPASVAEVAEAVRLCAERGVPIVPQGGNTAGLRAQASQAGADAVGGTLLGAGLGAALGAAVGGGRGAAVGAASGAVVGTGAGVANAQNTEAYYQQQYGAYYQNCMAYRRSPPPSPAYQQSYPPPSYPYQR
jgi:hypothetical protein